MATGADDKRLGRKMLQNLNRISRAQKRFEKWKGAVMENFTYGVVKCSGSVGQLLLKS